MPLSARRRPDSRAECRVASGNRRAPRSNAPSRSVASLYRRALQVLAVSGSSVAERALVLLAWPTRSGTSLQERQRLYNRSCTPAHAGSQPALPASHRLRGAVALMHIAWLQTAAELTLTTPRPRCGSVPEPAAPEAAQLPQPSFPRRWPPPLHGTAWRYGFPAPHHDLLQTAPCAPRPAPRLPGSCRRPPHRTRERD